MRTRTFAAMAAVTSLVAADVSTAKPVAYEGKTKGGYEMSFKRDGNKISRINGLVPTTCVSPQGGSPIAGGEIFKPPGSFRLGQTRKVKALQDSALHYSKVTKYYTVTMKKGRRGGFAGKLHVNFSFQTVESSPFSGFSLKTWVCRGDDSFSAR